MVKEGTALLVIDVQVGIIDGFHAYRGREVMEQINDLRTRARTARVPINKQLTAAQIIAHHNALLDGFDAGCHAIKVRAAEEVTI